MNKNLSHSFSIFSDGDYSSAEAQLTRGLEKESLRLQLDGHLAQDLHPKSLGSSLTHPMITTDFSESMLEFITKPSTDMNNPWEDLTKIHQYVYSVIPDQYLLATSMPIGLPEDPNAIPIAQYGKSHQGRFKEVYRRGLALRYGPFMQMIAGIHYNVSFPHTLFKRSFDHIKSDLPFSVFRSEQYLNIIRNFLRYSWIVPLLFGASPVLPKALENRKYQIGDSEMSVNPYATSYRLSPIGYQSLIQNRVFINYNSLPEYIMSMNKAVQLPVPEYAAFGLMKNGEWHQLNPHLLQIENEHYAWIRPKRKSQTGDRPIAVLAREGIEYIEIRAVDIDPFSPVGIRQEKAYFLDTFLFYCFLKESPPLFLDEMQNIRHNQQVVTLQGRNRHSIIKEGQKQGLLRDSARYLMDDLSMVAQWLGQCYGSHHYEQSLKEAYQGIEDYDKLISSQVTAQMTRSNQSFKDFALEWTKKHRQFFQETMNPSGFQELDGLRDSSLESYNQLESEIQGSFEAYCKDYFKDLKGDKEI